MIRDITSANKQSGEAIQNGTTGNDPFNVYVPTASAGHNNLLGRHSDVADRMIGGHGLASLQRSAGVDIARRVAWPLHSFHDGFDCRRTRR
jgi:hypothetical protein